MNILTTGFEPWGTERENPSGLVARAHGGVVLPVRWGAADRRLRRLIRERRPDAILMLGLASTRPRIEVEAVALNVDHCEVKPWTRRRKPIVGKGPLALSSRLPIARLLGALGAAKIPAGLSHHAGTFLCNHVFYLALHETRVPCGFVHLPPVSKLPLAKQIRAVGLILAILRRAGRGGASRGSPP